MCIGYETTDDAKWEVDTEREASESYCLILSEAAERFGQRLLKLEINE
jgi:hypothetical protein